MNYESAEKVASIYEWAHEKNALSMQDVREAGGKVKGVITGAATKAKQHAALAADATEKTRWKGSRIKLPAIPGVGAVSSYGRG